MRKIVILFFMLAPIYLISCNTAQKSISYTAVLTGVDKPSGIKSYQDVQLVENINDGSGVSYLYGDELINIIWNVDTEVFAFALENKSGYPIEIFWDDVEYYDWQGYEHRVIHKGVKYVNKNSPQLSTVVPQDSTIAEYLLPVANIYSTSGFFNSSYAAKSLFPSFKNQDAANKSHLKGQTIRIKFPVMVDGNKKDYLFAFKIDDIVMEK